jgi:hypothetical protein
MIRVPASFTGNLQDDLRLPNGALLTEKSSADAQGDMLSYRFTLLEGPPGALQGISMRPTPFPDL